MKSIIKTFAIILAFSAFCPISTLAQSKISQIEAEYNRMEAEYRSKLEQINASIAQAQNEIAVMRNDPMHSESNLISTEKWLDVLYSDRQRINDMLSNLQQQKSQAIQNQKDMEYAVKQAAEKAKRKKQQQDKEKAMMEQQQREMEKAAEEEAAQAKRQEENDAFEREMQLKRAERERQKQEAFNEGVADFDRKNGNSHKRGQEWAKNNSDKMEEIGNNVAEMAMGGRFNGKTEYRSSSQNKNGMAQNAGRTRSLNSLISKNATNEQPKQKIELLDIDKMLNELNY